jgi:hypothetical protein
MSFVTEIADRIYAARRQQVAALNESERAGGDWEISEAGKAYTAACAAERNALRKLEKARATDYADIILKASVLIVGFKATDEDYLRAFRTIEELTLGLIQRPDVTRATKQLADCLTSKATPSRGFSRWRG